MPGEDEGRRMLRGDTGGSRRGSDCPAGRGCAAARHAARTQVRAGYRGQVARRRGTPPVARGQQDGRVTGQDAAHRGGQSQKGRTDQPVHCSNQGNLPPNIRVL